MVTLTYQGSPTWSEAKADLKVWAQSFERIAGRSGIRCAAIWRAEVTKAGRPHFHLLLWLDGAPTSRLLLGANRATRAEVRETFGRLRKSRPGVKRRPSRDWCALTAVASHTWARRSQQRGGEYSALVRRSVDVTPLANGRQAAYYAAKYTAKVASGAAIDAPPGAGAVVGRHWGRFGDRALLAPSVWARMVLPNLPGRIEGLVGELRDMGLDGLASLVEARHSSIVAFALDDARDRLFEVLGRWAVPKLRRAARACDHPRCSEHSRPMVWAV